MVGAKVVQSDVSLSVDFLIVQNVMSMTKRASFGILAAQTNVNAFHQQTSERESFSQRPIGRTIGDHLFALFQRSSQSGVYGDTFGNGAENFADVLQRFFGHSRWGNSQRIASFEEIYENVFNFNFLFIYFINILILNSKTNKFYRLPSHGESNQSRLRIKVSFCALL